MPCESAMFIFEVVIEHVKSFVESKQFVIKSEFAEIFALELKDPKQMNIVIPEPPPLPPEPPGKKGKKKKPKPKKGKKGKKGVIVLPPPAPIIQAGQSILIASSAEQLIQAMRSHPLQLALWSNEEYFRYIGRSVIPWDYIYVTFLQRLIKCEQPPPASVTDEYNIFEEDTAKLIAKIGLMVKLSCIGDKVTTSFRCLSEDLSVKKYLYTGINSKTTSFMCTVKTSDELYMKNSAKVSESYVVDKPKPVVYADYKNAAATNATFFNDQDDSDMCCNRIADKPPESIYKSPETLPSIDFIIDYTQKMIASINDNMRMLTPRPTIRPIIRATDLDRLCYCQEKEWPEGALAERFKAETQSGVCPVCIKPEQRPAQNGGTFDIANIRGPCGRDDCKIARFIRAFIEDLAEEDDKLIDIDNIMGPCGSKNCSIAKQITKFLRHEGVFKLGDGATKEGLSTQCACVKKLNTALLNKDICDPTCDKECDSDSDNTCGGPGCPFYTQNQVYTVLYFTVQYGFEKYDNSSKSSQSPTQSSKLSPTQPPKGDQTPQTSKIPETSQTPMSMSRPASPTQSSKSSPIQTPKGGQTPQTSQTPRSGSRPASATSSSFRFCAKDCVELEEAERNRICSVEQCKDEEIDPSACRTAVCHSKAPCPSSTKRAPSPADSDIVIPLKNIVNPCTVKDCQVAEKIKDFIVDGMLSTRSLVGNDTENPCFCDCICDFNFTRNTTYCSICSGYECLGDDMRDQPPHLKPHPCPIYHKLYDKTTLQVKSPWPEVKSKPAEAKVSTPSRTNLDNVNKKGTVISKGKLTADKAENRLTKDSKSKKKGSKQAAPPVSEKYGISAPPKPVDKNQEKKYRYPKVKKNMGWNWMAEDVPGLPLRPKWKPGASHKLLVRKYRNLREGLDNILKKKRAAASKKKKIDPLRPTIVVKKHDGEFTVSMEVLKKFSKERLLYQYPYEDKPPIVYTIGKTELEKRKIQNLRERRERRENRRKNKLIQQTFRDKCQEICVKAYNQAIGVLPLPNPNSPECPCVTKPSTKSEVSTASCSCSDEDITSSDTDNDEWTIEFTPPIARWIPKAKHPPVLADAETHYTYTDYRVKILDKKGNQIPRFFIGPNGKQECSDLGGFWGKGKVWLEINKDGYLGPDNRWVPNHFVGPDGSPYSADEGFITTGDGRDLKIGIDGYIDEDLKWVFYRSGPKTTSKSATTPKTGQNSPPKSGNSSPPKTGNISPPKAPAPVKEIQQKCADKIISNRNVKNVSQTTRDAKKNVVMSVSVNQLPNGQPRLPHTPGTGMRLDMKRAMKYREIMADQEMYDHNWQTKSPTVTTTNNRASNTPRRIISPFTMHSTRYNPQKGYMPSYAPETNADRTITNSETVSSSKL